MTGLYKFLIFVLIFINMTFHKLFVSYLIVDKIRNEHGSSRFRAEETTGEAAGKLGLLLVLLLLSDRFGVDRGRTSHSDTPHENRKPDPESTEVNAKAPLDIGNGAELPLEREQPTQLKSVALDIGRGGSADVRFKMSDEGMCQPAAAELCSSVGWRHLI